MNVANELERQASQFALRHERFLLALRGVMSEAIGGKDWMTQRGIGQVRRQGRELGRQHFLDQRESMRKLADDLVSGLCSGAKTSSVEGRARASQHAASLLKESWASLQAQIERDVLAAERQVRHMAMRVRMLADNQGWSLSASAIAVREQTQGDPRFRFVDRSGRAWGSQRYVRTLLRALLFELHNECTMILLADMGFDSAVVRYPEPHRFDGIIISLIGHDGLPTYDQLRDDVFHPNSPALISHR
ncbi:hypothetical protein [Ectothiorhodospira shaposhnikovii]|uniref:hypothetical protein n=1 Tax=Ectothiorhodospira shaposhnikovii TaxID=1054 RepID=UPI001EE98E9D|nr:hypothetical protein [Ectothiorhodospira shaposhnikovii]MCG5512855.1 hypothetical protein [Ectothiorhodospira shaposhnikovii]